MRAPTHIVMVGTAFDTRGGIASVVQAWREAGLLARWPVEYVASHRDGSRLLRLAKAIDGLCAFLALACRHSRAVLHVHSASRASFWRKSLFMALALAARWPVVFHLHGGGFATFYEECGPLRRALVRFFLDRAAYIVVVSRHWATWMQGVARRARVVVVPNAVAMPPESAARERALIAFAGRCTAGKGIPELLRTVATLRGIFPELRLECAGDGDLDAVRAQARALGIERRVELHGWIGTRAREDLLARAAVFVLPSHAEGLPMSLLEAMAAGCPVVASAVGGIPDLISHGYNGLLVPPGDAEALARAVERVLADPALAFAMGRAARATVASRYTADLAVEALGRIYSQLGVRAEENRGQSPISKNRGQSPSPVPRRDLGRLQAR